MTVSCNPPERPAPPDSVGGSAYSARVATPENSTPGGTQRGDFVDGDERSSWMLTTTRDGGISIEEDARFGDDGQANRVFTFDAAGMLLRATEQRTGTAQSAGNTSPALVRTELIIDFTVTPPSATKMVDDVRRTVEPYEIENIRRRGDVLLQQARRSSPR